MSRFFKPLTKSDFEQVIETLLAGSKPTEHDETPETILDALYSRNAIVSKVFDDVAKIEFDSENIATSDTDFNLQPEECGFLGTQVLPNGMPYLGVLAGGDWELPVWFIVYYDGKHLRGYVPTDGNTFNKSSKSAFGNNEDADKEELTRLGAPPDADGYCDIRVVKVDLDKLKSDIQARILPRP